MLIYDALTKNPLLLVLVLVAAFGVIVLAVILIRKYAPAFKNTEQPKTEKEIAEEEVNRLLVDIEELKDPNAPTEEEALDYEMSHILEEGDENYQAQAEAYQKEHPEEGDLD